MIWIKIKYRFLVTYHSLLFKLGFGKFLLKNRYGERILVFHGIDVVGETKYNSRFHSKSYFEVFIKYISEHFNVISLDDYYQKKFNQNTLNIAITFDDGYLNNYKYAVPILKKYNIPATFYITTITQDLPFLWPDFVDLVSYYSNKENIVFENATYQKNIKNEFFSDGISLKNKCKKLSFEAITKLYTLFEEDWKLIQSKPLEDYWKLMTNEQIKEISKNPLFTIGSHSFSHSNLIEIPIDEAKSEILKGKENLEAICEQPIFEFAFPFGNYNAELISYCKEIGIEKIVLLDFNHTKDTLDATLRNRFIMNPYISMNNQLVFLLKGTYF